MRVGCTNKPSNSTIISSAYQVGESAEASAESPVGISSWAAVSGSKKAALGNMQTPNLLSTSAMLGFRSKTTNQLVILTSLKPIFG
jgi:hypothetical protein